MPYLNTLASANGLATHYCANAHPSIGNYFVLTTGQIETLDDEFNGIISDDNIVRELVNAKEELAKLC
jgi:acid phosphatase